jgi:type III secretory pathway component EscU
MSRCLSCPLYLCIALVSCNLLEFLCYKIYVVCSMMDWNLEPQVLLKELRVYFKISSSEFSCHFICREGEAEQTSCKHVYLNF